MPRNKKKNAKKPVVEALKQCAISASLSKVSENQFENKAKSSNLDHNKIEDEFLASRKCSKLSAIFIHKPIDFKNHKHALVSLGIKFHESTNSRVYTRIKCASMEDHISFIQYLKRNKLPYHTFGDPTQKKMRVVIRGLPLDTCLKTLKEDLKSMNIPVLRIHKMHTLQTKRPHPLLVLAVLSNEDGKKLLDVKELLGHQVKIENPVPKAKQCHRCQKWGHAQRYCHGIVKCVKCAGLHASAKCIRDPKKEPPKCANCGGGHTANYRKCPCCPASNEYKMKNTNPDIESILETLLNCL